MKNLYPDQRQRIILSLTVLASFALFAALINLVRAGTLVPAEIPNNLGIWTSVSAEEAKNQE